MTRARTSAERRISPRSVARDHEALLAHCGVGVLFLDKRGRVRSLNARAAQLLVINEESLLDHSLTAAIDSSEFTALVRAARTHGVTSSDEVTLRDAILRVHVHPLKTERAPMLVVLHDMTMLRRMETIRRDFVANVSHELRTPLASIRAMAETLRGGALDDAVVADHFLDTIINESQRLTRISEDLLILSRIESRAPFKKDFSLSNLICEIVQRFTPQAEAAHVLLDAHVPDALLVRAGPDEMEQVVINLIDNAIKYTPAGGHVRVVAERLEKEVVATVADSGIGIAVHDQPRIFERFYRVDKARSRQSGGTGLGLAIVKHIVEAHGGRVAVFSTPGKGSTFTFTVPVD
ncbi:MAG: hypothetical protein KGJ62_03330 [Armatimonadetes bacterium]|nr:hypothetical protein [Armatimonadota bacterium]MDE2205734.1 hypothetical protein [Armatimonadota bacterium]